MNSKIFMAVIVPLSILLPLFIGAIKYRQLSGEAKLIYWYLVISAIFTVLSLLIARFYHKNTMPVTHLFTLIESGFILFFYKTLLGVEKRNHSYIYLFLAFTIACIINAFFFQSIYTYNSYTKSIESIICILLAMNYFAAIASGTIPTKISTSAGFYFNAGFFLYFSGAFMLFVFSNFIITNLSLNNFLIIWTIHASLVLLMYLFFTFAFILCKK
jgi:hypothetical protein